MGAAGFVTVLSGVDKTLLSDSHGCGPQVSVVDSMGIGMPDTKYYERPFVRCLSKTAAGFLISAPAATLVTGVCLLCLWVFGFLLVMFFVGPVYSLFVGIYCAKTIRNSGALWQMLLIAAAAASGMASWYLWGVLCGPILGYGGFWWLAASIVSGVWVGPTVLNLLRLAIRQEDLAAEPPSFPSDDRVAFEVRNLRGQLARKS